jgi:hypothetical protein
LVAAAAVAFLTLGSSGARIGGPVAQAATLSSNTPGYRMRMSLQMSSSALASPITASGTGVVDLRDHASSMSVAMNLGNNPQAFSQLAGGAPVTQALGGSTVQMAMVTTKDAVYLQLPSGLIASLPTSGRRWVKVEIGKFSGLPGLASFGGGNPTTSDPTNMLHFLRSSSGVVIVVGHQRVDGAQTTHYRTELSVSHLADGLPAGERDAVQQGLARVEQALTGGQLPVDVWVDAHGHVRRVVMSLDITIPNGASLQELVRMDLTDYGPQTVPTPPPPDQVIDLSSLAGGTG